MKLSGKRVVVMGLGRFGGGVGVTRFLCRHGARVLVTDQLGADALEASLAQLDGLEIALRLGGHDESDFVQADLVVVNPAVKPRGNRYLAAAREAGVALSSEIRLLIRHLPRGVRTIGITGTAGKSTVTAMIGHGLKRLLPRVWVGGNLGGSLLEDVEEIEPRDPVVLELSSFMLEGLSEDHWSPRVAVVTNLAPNHLDWHGTFEDYRDAKQSILNCQGPDDVAVLGPGVASMLTTSRQTVRVVEERALRPVELAVPGRHNVINANLALSACEAVGVAASDVADALRDFPGLPHRLEWVGRLRGADCYNDSKSTTPQATQLALEAFERGKVHLIAGGYDKGSDLTGLAREAKAHCRAVYLIGDTGVKIARLAQDSTGGADIAVVGTLESAVEAAAERLRDGDVLLLSPGCASWDQFENYEQRGIAFKAWVAERG